MPVASRLHTEDCNPRRSIYRSSTVEAPIRILLRLSGVTYHQPTSLRAIQSRISGAGEALSCQTTPSITFGRISRSIRSASWTYAVIALLIPQRLYRTRILLIVALLRPVSSATWPSVVDGLAVRSASSSARARRRHLSLRSGSFAILCSAYLWLWRRNTRVQVRCFNIAWYKIRKTARLCTTARASRSVAT